MKPDILTLCILATTILASTRHVIGFLTSQTSSSSSLASSAGIAGNGIGIGPASVVEQQQQENDVVIQPRRHLDATLERNVYDPGDELLQALNTELGLAMPEPEEPDYVNAVNPNTNAIAIANELEVASKFDMLKKLEDDLRAEQELVDKSALLMKMLEDPTLDTLPLVYVEEEEPAAITAVAGNDDYPELETGLQSLVLGQTKPKRSRYYRRYPWKRHNRNRGSYMNSINSNYEPELRYACTPSKEDIFKLLVNLHENRKGNHSKTVNFCNRKRPAKAVFTNIRFLG
ncbi:uncharacterized protein LOC132798631 isoform X1 [Drosophila nasuta]|uniref:uncharacterized protein LOC132798631 isoform X1 n=1 Tax=Drosophila nasuta TaxID=42062 RepID=UPI00295EF295|nr:uncharacterized protein LOC132798631 isoform X1 [Drosophila nasuta]XP_060666548.1 uncharacterized protein LOC132798631 isoform X1 [Drosophila nasuta]